MNPESIHINGSEAPAPLLDASRLKEWAFAHGLDPELVELDEEGYPCDDGVPMPSKAHLEQIVYGYSVLEAHYRSRPDVLVSGDMMVHESYRGKLKSAMPDLFVAFGVVERDDDWPSYKLWQDGAPPQFVMEFLSRSNKMKDLDRNFDNYARLGVQEYWIFDTPGEDIEGRVAGHRLDGQRYLPISPRPPGLHRSDVLGLDIASENDKLRFIEPSTGERLMTYQEFGDAMQELQDAQQRDREGRLAAERAAEEAQRERLAAEAALKKLAEDYAELQAARASRASE